MIWIETFLEELLINCLTLSYGEFDITFEMAEY